MASYDNINIFQTGGDASAERRYSSPIARAAAQTQQQEGQSWLTPARLSWFLTQLRPSAGITDLLEMEPGLPPEEAGLGEFMSAEPMAGMTRNISEGNYLDALLQGVGAAGDVAYVAAPFTAGAGIPVGAALKGIGALGKGIRATRKAGKPIDEGISTLPTGAAKASSNPYWDDLYKNSGGEFWRGEGSSGQGAKLGALGTGFYGTHDFGMAEAFAKMPHHQGKGRVNRYKIKEGLRMADDKGAAVIAVRRKLGFPPSGYGNDAMYSNLMKSHLEELGYDGVASRDRATGFVVFDQRNTTRVSAEGGIGDLPRHVAKEGGVFPVVRKEGLSHKMSELEDRAFDFINSDPENILMEYSRLKGTDGGRIISSDEAKELFDFYKMNRALSDAFHNPSSAVAKRWYTRMLQEEAPRGMKNEVFFTAGGTGSGKTSAIKGMLGDELKNAQIIYDTNLANFDGATRKIDEALDAKKAVNIVYVYRDPMDSLVAGMAGRTGGGGVLTRAQGSGRVVPVTAHATTHAGSADTIKRLAVHYEDNPAVSIRVIDNNYGKQKAAAATLDDIPDLDYNEIYEGSMDAIEKAFAQNEISERIYKGLKGIF